MICDFTFQNELCHIKLQHVLKIFANKIRVNIVNVKTFASPAWLTTYQLSKEICKINENYPSKENEYKKI